MRFQETRCAAGVLFQTELPFLDDSPQTLKSRKDIATKMTKASVKAKYDSGSQSALTTISVGVGDLKVKASVSDTTFVNGASLTGVGLGVEKPGAFIIDYDVPSNAARFQFMSSAKVAGKNLKLTYIHAHRGNAAILETSVVLNPKNKVTGEYSFLGQRSKLKYSYVRDGNTTVEPGYDFGSESWYFTVSQKFSKEDTLKATYDAAKQNIGIEWSKESKEVGNFKITGTVSATGKAQPKIVAEKTWDYHF